MSKTAYNITLKGYVVGEDFDRFKVDRTLADNGQDFHFVVCHEFELHGWHVESVYLGNPVRHDEFSCQRAQSQARLGYAECSRECVYEKYLLINQGLLPEVAYFAVAEQDPPQKFPYHDSFALSISGVS